MSQDAHRLYFLLVQVADRLKKTADRHLLAHAKLSTSQAAALRIVVEAGGTTQRHVARTLRQQESAVATMAKRLEAAGFISRTRSDTDRRAWRLEPTREGRAALSKLLAAFVPIDARAKTVLSKADIETLADRMTALLAALDAPDEDEPKQRRGAP